MTRHFLFALVALLLGAFILFWIRGSIIMDPDFGWHLRMGDVIRTSGIPYTDPFSYTMPSYPVISHEWLTDVVMSLLFPHIGYGGLAGIFAAIATTGLVFPLLLVTARERRFAFLPLFIAIMTLVNFVGVRPQVLTWFFFSLILYLVTDYRRLQRFFWLVPLLFALWANMHAGFVVGSIVVLLAAVYWYIQKRLSLRSLLLFVSVCVLATGVTPYGFRMWFEMLQSMSDANLHWTIQEWRPMIAHPYVVAWAYVLVSFLLVLRFWKRLSLFTLLLYGSFCIAGLLSMRHFPLWVVSSLPITITALQWLFQEVSVIPEGKRRFMQGFGVFFGIVCLLSLQSAVTLFFYRDPYPEKAALYLSLQSQEGNIFSIYDWGGYLIWKNPTQKVFIDGRMPSWKWQAPRGESNYAFGEYQQLLRNPDSFESIVTQYNIRMLVLPVGDSTLETAPLGQLSIWANQTAHLPLEESIGVAWLAKKAEQEGWQKVYEDEKTVIYQKPSERKFKDFAAI